MIITLVVSGTDGPNSPLQRDATAAKARANFLFLGIVDRLKTDFSV